MASLRAGVFIIIVRQRIFTVEAFITGQVQFIGQAPINVHAVQYISETGREAVQPASTEFSVYPLPVTREAVTVCQRLDRA